MCKPTRHGVHDHGGGGGLFQNSPVNPVGPAEANRPAAPRRTRWRMAAWTGHSGCVAAPQAHLSDRRVSILSPPVAVLWSGRSKTSSPGETTMSLTLAAATSISRSINHTAMTNTSAEWAARSGSNAARSAKLTKGCQGG